MQENDRCKENRDQKEWLQRGLSAERLDVIRAEIEENECQERCQTHEDYRSLPDVRQQPKEWEGAENSMVGGLMCPL